MTSPLEEIEKIKQLKARYFRLLDTKDWEGFRTVFTDDIVFDMSGSGGRVHRGIDEFVAFVKGVVDDAVTVHQGHMPEIDVTASDQATGIWVLHDIVIWPNGRRLEGYGHYHERYKKCEDGWRIAWSRLTRLLTEVGEAETRSPREVRAPSRG